MDTSTKTLLAVFGLAAFAVLGASAYDRNQKKITATQSFHNAIAHFSAPSIWTKGGIRLPKMAERYRETNTCLRLNETYKIAVIYRETPRNAFGHFFTSWDGTPLHNIKMKSHLLGTLPLYDEVKCGIDKAKTLEAATAETQNTREDMLAQIKTLDRTKPGNLSYIGINIIY